MKKLANPVFIFYLLIYIFFTSCTDSKTKESAMNNSATENRSDYKVTFIELGSVNCVPCRMMQPVMKNIENTYGDQVNVVFYDVWTEADKKYASDYNIRVIPTQIFLDSSGSEYFRHEGFFPEEELIEVLKQQGVK